MLQMQDAHTSELGRGCAIMHAFKVCGSSRGWERGYSRTKIVSIAPRRGCNTEDQCHS